MLKNHIGVEQLGYLLDDEPEGVLLTTWTHLESCPQCREELIRMQQSEPALAVENWLSRREGAIARVQTAIAQFDKEQMKNIQLFTTANSVSAKQAPVSTDLAGSFWAGLLASFMGQNLRYAFVLLAFLTLGAVGFAYDQRRDAKQVKTTLKNTSDKVAVYCKRLEANLKKLVDTSDRDIPEDLESRLLALGELIEHQSDALEARQPNAFSENPSENELQNELAKLRLENKRLREKSERVTEEYRRVKKLTRLSFTNRPDWIVGIDYPNDNQVQFTVKLDPKQIYERTIFVRQGNDGRPVPFTPTITPLQGRKGGTVVLTMNIQDLTSGRYKLEVIVTKENWGARDKSWEFTLEQN